MGDAMRRSPFDCVVPLLLMAWTGLQAAQQPTAPAQPPSAPLPGAVARAYKTVGGAALSLHMFTPATRSNGTLAPAIVFFFGGGLNPARQASERDAAKQFVEHSKYFASRGMVGVVAEYRVLSRPQVTALDAVADAKSVLRWVRAHARELGVDPERIVASGASAGGYLAASTAMISGFDDPDDDRSVSPRPNALVLFNPVVDVTDREGRGFGSQARAALPLHQIRKALPPMIILHGSADENVPFAVVEQFTARMREVGNRCELVRFEGRTHGFFNYGRGDGQDFTATVQKADEFLISLGYLQA